MACKCIKDLAKFILFSVNSLIFLIALAVVVFAVYLFCSPELKVLMKHSLLVGVLIAALVMMIVSLLGCCAARKEPEKRFVLGLYLLILCAMIAAQATVAVLVYDVGGALQHAGVSDDTWVIDAQSSWYNAEKSAFTYLHDQVGSLYGEGNCRDGMYIGYPVEPTAPVKFTKITCDGSSGIQSVFGTLLQDNANLDNVTRFDKCRTRGWWGTQKTPTDITITQVFCHGEAHITELAKKYYPYMEIGGIVMASLEFLLLMSTLILICRRRRAVQRARANQPLMEEGQHGQLAQTGGVYQRYPDAR